MGAWKTWTPTFTGFSVNPPSVTARYTQIGKLVIAFVAMGNGTSNASTFTLTLPVAAANTVKQQFPAAVQTNNGAALLEPALIKTRVNSTTADIFKDASGAGWSTIGGKKVIFTIMYETN